MADRYVVMSIAEARASGKRASGFATRIVADEWCLLALGETGREAMRRAMEGRR